MSNDGIVQCERCGNIRKNEEDGEIWNDFWYCPECITKRENLVQCVMCSTFDLKEYSTPYEQVWDDDTDEYVKTYICHSSCGEDKILALIEVVEDEDMMYTDVEESYDSETYGYKGQSWLVLTEDEVKERLKGYHSREFWVVAVQSDTTNDSFEEWQEEVISMSEDAVLSTDGYSHEIEIGGEYYYIFKQ